MQFVARLSLRKHNSATLIFPSESQNIVNAMIWRAGSSRTKAEIIYARWRLQKTQEPPREYNASLGRALEIKENGNFAGLGVGSTQRSLRKHDCATFTVPASVSPNGKLFTLLGWAHKNIANSFFAQLSLRRNNNAHWSFLRSSDKYWMLYFVCWASEHTPKMPYFGDGLSLCKHSNYNILLGWASGNTEHATFAFPQYCLHCLGLCFMLSFRENIRNHS